jgi:curved DNA-binding protein CbpA
MPKDTKLYDILGITTTANENEIKKVLLIKKLSYTETFMF